MKLLIINEYGHNEIKDSDILPRLGDKVDIFYNPYPTVTQVLLFPSAELLGRLGRTDIDAVITVA